MPITFLLILLIVALALVAPLLAIVCIVLSCIAQLRRIGLLGLAIGTVFGAIVLTGWLLLSYFFPAPMYNQWQSVAIFFGAGFTIGVGLAFVWHLATRPRPNNSFKPTPLRGAA
jgi:uncharacterized membrane protein